MDILLTNDDGIDSPGIQVLYDVLESIGDVLLMAPAKDQSAVGRAMSSEVAIEERGRGYAVHGTPVDCVVAGLEAIGPYPDLVVAGCNKGANLGEYVLGRSGTVSAAVEAAFFGVPAIAVSLYIPIGELSFDGVERHHFEEAVRATEYLVEHAGPAGVFEHAEYLNVNVPIPGDAPAPMEITRPARAHHLDATQNGDGTITLHDRIWERMRDGKIDDPEGSDRRAVYEGRVSVSPLTAPHSTERHDALDALAETYLG